MRRILVVSTLATCAIFSLYSIALTQAKTIRILNEGKPIPWERTSIDAGPAVGDILNNHYFPALVFYRHGNFVEAVNEFDYFLARPHYTEKNPRQAEFFSTGHYVRGYIYLHHASGLGRHGLAKQDFEESIRWNPRNALAYLELARLYHSLAFNGQAISVLERLLKLDPEGEFANHARRELEQLSPGK